MSSPDSVSTPATDPSLKVNKRETSVGGRTREKLKPDWMEGIGPRSTQMGNLYNYHPDEWKNIALPIVEVITTLLREVYKLHLRIDHDMKFVEKIDKNEREHHRLVTKDISELGKKLDKETNRLQTNILSKLDEDIRH